MYASFRAFATDLIDYAGLFPPAELPLEAAIRDYTRYREEADSWMLARFICPAGRLAELPLYRDELFRAGPPLRISVLLTGAEDAARSLDRLRRDLEAIAAFRERHGERVAIELIEGRLPAQPASPRDTAEGIDRVVRGLASQTEIPTGFKIRCGGASASDFPSSDQVAFTIAL